MRNLDITLEEMDVTPVFKKNYNDFSELTNKNQPEEDNYQILQGTE